MILYLLACGVSGDMPQPATPPVPPPDVAQAEIDKLEFQGTVVELSSATRSWTALGDGKRLICVLGIDGRILADGKDILPDQLKPGDLVTVRGREFGDVILVESATLGGSTTVAASPVAGDGAPLAVPAVPAAPVVPPEPIPPAEAPVVPPAPAPPVEPPAPTGTP